MSVTVTRIKRELKKRGITQDKLAILAGVTRTCVNHYLNGRRGSPRVKAVVDRLLGTEDHGAA